MKPYETSATVEEQGRLQISGVPFAAGTAVDVTVRPKASPGEEVADRGGRSLAAARDLVAADDHACDSATHHTLGVDGRIGATVDVTEGCHGFDTIEACFTEQPRQLRAHPQVHATVLRPRTVEIVEAV